MILIVCLDMRDGICFNHRRQSADRCVTEKILQLSQGRKLFVQAGSAGLFPKERIIVSEQPLQLAGPGDVCFLESGDIGPYADKVERLIVFRWDKVYPSDVTFPMSCFRDRMTQKETAAFCGYSHDVITQEVYER